MIDFSKVKSLSDLPENVRELCVEKDGVISLDETKVKTEQDVANVKKAKDKEVAEHNIAKAKLAKYQALNLEADEIATRIEELESHGETSDEQHKKLVSLQREHAKLKSESAAYKTELDEIKPQFEAFRKESHQRKTGDSLAEFVGTLKGVDNERLTRALKKDIMLGLIDLDEAGESLVCKDGGKLEDYAMNTAKDFGFILKSTPGNSNPGMPAIPSSVKKSGNELPGAEESIFDDDIKAKLDA